MSAFKVEWVYGEFLKPENQVGGDRVPVVRLEAVRAWLEAHKYQLQYGATAHNGVIDDLLDELDLLSGGRMRA